MVEMFGMSFYCMGCLAHVCDAVLEDDSEESWSRSAPVPNTQALRFDNPKGYLVDPEVD